MLPLFAALTSQAAAQDAEEPTPPTFQLVCVDDAAHGYATFQSHNQKVVANQHGIFMTHIRTRNEAYTAQQWRLLRSADDGKSFSILFEATDATNPPVLETDTAGNLYLGRPDFTDGNAYLYRFLAEKEFKDPVITSIPGASAGKYSMFLDGPRGQLYYFAHNGTFNTIGLDGTVRASVQLLKAGEHAVPQYPLLCMDPNGDLHAAWTSQKHDVYMYWDIHHMLSPDAGKTWRTMDGTALSLPVPADDSGPATRITLDDEFDFHTWLCSFTVKDGKAHFFYLAQTDPKRQHYMRYELETGERDVHIHPIWKAKSLQISTFDGFFATAPGKPLYCVGQHQGHLVCLVSRDNGASWHDYAQSDETFNVYSLGGCRALTSDGHIIGSFTDQGGSNLIPGQESKVHFFKLKTQ
jgi:hypothetical protein